VNRGTCTVELVGVLILDAAETSSSIATRREYVQQESRRRSAATPRFADRIEEIRKDKGYEMCNMPFPGMSTVSVEPLEQPYEDTAQVAQVVWAFVDFRAIFLYKTA